MPDSTPTPPTAAEGDINKTFPLEGLLPDILNISLTGIILFKPVYQPETNQIIDLAYQMLNPAAQRMLGLPALPKQTFLQLYPKALKTGIFAFYRDTFLSGEPGQYQVNYQHDGLNNYFHLAAQRSGQGLVVSFTDTADQDRSPVEQALRESQTREQAARAQTEQQRVRLERLFNQAPAALAMLEGPELVFKVINEAYQQLFPGRDLVNRPLFEALAELKEQPVATIIQQVYQTGETYEGKEVLIPLARYQDQPVEDIYWNFIYQAIYDAQGRVNGILIFALDVTSFVQARRQVEQSAGALQELNRQLEEQVVRRTRSLQLAQAEAERQRRRLETLFMKAPAPICILAGPDLVYELVNPSYEQLFPGRQLLGKPILEVLPEIADNPVYRTFREVYETGITHEEPELLIPLYRRQDGVLENRYFRYIQQARYDEHEHIDGVLVFAFEVTDQVQARQAVEASAKQLRLITDALPVLIGYLDQEEKYRFANQTYEAWFNQKPEDLLGRSVREVVGEEAYQNAKGYIDRALAGERLNFEARMPYREDFIKHTHTNFVPHIEEGQVVGFYILVDDITEQLEARRAVEASEQQAQALATKLAVTNQELRRAIEELAITNQQLTHTNVDLDNFIYTASHDLKAPILNIEGLVEALREELPMESLQATALPRIINLIADSVQRFKRTISHLTEITKLQKENVVEVTAVNLAAVIADVQLDLAPAIEAIQAQIAVEVSACPTIHFSAKNLRSILYNLLSNAIKYHSPERVPLVRVNGYTTGEYQVLLVQDNGLGIDLTQEHKLYAMFQRLHTHVEGSGIGLYMVKRMIENAGGKIEVQSKVGEGSVFRVYFKKEK